MDYHKKFGAFEMIMTVITIVIVLSVFLWNFLTHRV